MLSKPLNFEKLCIPLLPGSSSLTLLSTTDLEEKLERVCVHLEMLRMEGEKKNSFLIIFREILN